MLGNLSTSAKLWLLGVLSFLGLALVSAVGILGMGSMAERIDVDLHGNQMDSQSMIAVKSAQSSFLVQIQEWKNILLRGNDQEGFDKHLKSFRVQAEKTQAQLAQAADLMQGRELPADQAQALRAAHAALTEKYLEALAKFERGDALSGKNVDKAVRGMDRATVEGMNKLVVEIEERLTARVQTQIAASQADNRQTRMVFIGLAITGMLVVAMLAVVIQRDIMGRLGGEPARVVDIARQIAAGDLSQRLTGTAGPDSLMASMSRMQGALHDLVARIQTVAIRLADAAENLATTSSQVACSSSQQSSASAEMAAAIEEMTASINLVADHAGAARSLADESRQLSVSSGQLVQDTIRDIHLIAGAVQSSTTVVYGLGEQSDRISGIANVIKEIADQTNLLALNAAIEAARAGEAGRGFAVVADEVRKLAEKTTLSTQQISTMIQAIHNGTEEAVEKMEAGSQRVEAGVKTAADTGASMAQIENGTVKVLEAVDEISLALHEQGIASTQVARNVEQIAQMTEENSAAVGEVSRAAGELRQLAQDLKTMVGHFRLG